jgi:hypothetical protein
VNIIEEVDRVKDIQNGLLNKLFSLNAQFKRLTQGIADKYNYNKIGFVYYNRKERGTQTGEDEHNRFLSKDERDQQDFENMVKSNDKIKQRVFDLAHA